MVVTRPHYAALDDVNKDVYILASGGRDSSAMVLEAFAQGIDATMVFNDTNYNRSGAIKVLEQLKEITSYPLQIVKYDGAKQPRLVLRESFEKIPDVLDGIKRTGKYAKNYFYCCEAFKHRPTTRFIKTLDPERSVLLMGIKGSDGSVYRRIWLGQLRNICTYYRKNVKNSMLYYYPLRDCSDRDIDYILAEWNLEYIKSTGCKICPVFCVFPKMRHNDFQTWHSSTKLAKQMGIEFPMSDQSSLEDFIEK